MPLTPAGPFPVATQRALGEALMKAVGFDFAHGRLDTSLHPFCGGVPDDVREAARGMGYSPARQLFRVELPLAVPALVAGLRIATVSTIGLATIGAYVGSGGLGSLIFEGFNNDYHAEIMTASLLCIALAVVADVFFVVAQRFLTPWQRRQ